MMSQIKLLIIAVCLSLVLVETASAQPGWRYRRGYYGYRPAYAYPPVVVAPPLPPPVIVAPAYTYPAPAYVVPRPMYAPPVYGYGVVGPRRRFGVGYNSPGFGVYLGR